MKLNRATSLIALLAIAGSLWGADPFAGTWKFNSAKSQHFPGDESAPWLKEWTVTIEEQEGDEIWTDRFLSSDGKASARAIRVSAQGGEFRVVGKPAQAAASTLVLKRAGDHNMDVIHVKDGAELATEHMTLSTDGKTLTNTVKGTSSVGKRLDRVEVFDRQ